MSLPVVSVDVGDVALLVRGVREAVVVPARDPAALAGAVEAALDLPATRDGPGRARAFSIEASARRLLEIYRRAAGRG